MGCWIFAYSNIFTFFMLELCFNPTYIFIRYRTVQGRPENTKDGIYDWIYNIQVNVVSDKYDTVCDLCSDVVDKLLELEEVLDINIESISEDYIENAYVKQIDIIIKK